MASPDDDDDAPRDLDVGAQPFCVAFHPRESSTAAVGLVTGTLKVYDVETGTERAGMGAANLGSCRVLSWAGDRLLTGYESGEVRLWDMTRTAASIHSRVSGAACSAVANEGLFFVGDDDGGITMIDPRQAATVRRRRHHEDFVADLTTHDNCILAAGSDGRLSVSDPRRNLAAVGVSDPQDDELLSLRVIRGGRKVVCGTQTGALVIWSWDRWQDSTDRALGHPESVDAILKIHDDVLLTGSSDGMLRVVRVLPGLDLLGILGDHDGFPVERLAANANLSLVASLSHDNLVRFWDANELHQLPPASSSSPEDDDDALMAPVQGDDDDDDVWETDDDDDSDDDDSDDDDVAPARPMPQQPRRGAGGGSSKHSSSFFDGL